MASVSLWLKAYFATVGVISMVIGVALYSFPALVIGFWPYSVKSLAARMFASMFLAVGITAGFALRERERSYVQVVLVQGVPMFALVLLAALFSFPSLRLGDVGGVAWVALFAAVVAVGGIFLARDGGQLSRNGATGDELRVVPRGLRLSLLLHTVVVFLFGLTMLFGPALALNFWPWKVSTVVMQGLGGLFVGTTIGIAWCYAQGYWERMRVIFPGNAAFALLVLIAVAFDWSVVVGESPGLHVTVLWLLLYSYVAFYLLYFFWHQTPQR